MTIQGTIHAQSYIVSESIVVATSGSTIFGNSSDDLHKFTGSINSNGIIVANDLQNQNNNPVVFSIETGSFLQNSTTSSALVKNSETGSFLTNIQAGSNQGVLTKTSQDAVGAVITVPNLGTTSNPKFNHITASGDISASGKLYVTDDVDIDGDLDVDGSTTLDGVGINGNFSLKSNDLQMGRSDATFLVSPKAAVHIHGDLNISSHITSSGNIKVSGDISSSGTIISNVMTPTTITNVSTTHITASGNISASGNLKIGGDLFMESAESINLNSVNTIADDRIYYTESTGIVLDSSEGVLVLGPHLNVTGDITASGNISSSNKIQGNTFKVGPNALQALSQVDGILDIGKSSDQATLYSTPIHKFNGKVFVNSPFESSGSLSVNYGDGDTMTGSIGTLGHGYGDITEIGGGTITTGRIHALEEDGDWVSTGETGPISSSLLCIGLGDGKKLLRGTVNVSTAGVTTIGQKVYAGTSGRLSATAPSDSGDVVRVVGYTLSGSGAGLGAKIYFNPDNTWVEVS